MSSQDPSSQNSPTKNATFFVKKYHWHTKQENILIFAKLYVDT